jgi:hypothetical protein
MNLALLYKCYKEQGVNIAFEIELKHWSNSPISCWVKTGKAK